MVTADYFPEGKSVESRSAHPLKLANDPPFPVFQTQDNNPHSWYLQKEVKQMPGDLRRKISISPFPVLVIS